MPSAKLTDRFIRAQKAGESRVEHWDQETPGLGLRVGISGVRTFVYRYRTAEGKRRRMTLGRFPGLSLAEARRKANEARLAVSDGGDPVSAKEKAIQERRAARAQSFAVLAADYLERHAKRKKRSWREDERYLNSDVLPQWADLPVAEIGRRHVLALLDAKAETAPTAANRLRALLSKLFVFGIQRGYMDSNPAQYVDRPAKETPRQRVLTDDEIRRLWTVLDDEGPVTAATFRLRLLTAQRSREVRTMRWADLDGDWWTVPAEIAKNGQAHRVPLSAPVLEILDELRPITGASEWVCESPAKRGEPIGRLQSAIRRIRRRAELEDWTPHDLRRTAATQMRKLGADRITVARILNHTDGSVTAVYDRHSYDDEKRRALDTWAERVDDIVSGSEPADVVNLADRRTG